MPTTGSRPSAQHTGKPPEQLSPKPLTPQAFQKYGKVLDLESPYMVNDGYASRLDILVDLDHIEVNPQLCIAHFDVTAVPTPAIVQTLEIHPFSSQAFIPITKARPLIVVTRSAADGSPDLNAVEAFIGAEGQAIIYAATVWHAGLTTVDGDGQFIMAMWRGDRSDTTTVRLPNPIEVDIAPPLGSADRQSRLPATTDLGSR